MRDEQHRDDVVTGRAWADFCDALKSAGDLVTANSTDDLDRIEGFRYLSRLARGGLRRSSRTAIRFAPSSCRSVQPEDRL